MAVSRKIFVGSVSFRSTEASLERHFSQYGPVEQAQVMTDHTGNPRGFAFITFATEAAMRAALETRHPKVDGRVVDVKQALSREAAPPPVKPRDPATGGTAVVTEGTAAGSAGGRARRRRSNNGPAGGSSGVGGDGGNGGGGGSSNSTSTNNSSKKRGGRRARAATDGEAVAMREGSKHAFGADNNGEESGSTVAFASSSAPPAAAPLQQVAALPPHPPLRDGSHYPAPDAATASASLGGPLTRSSRAGSADSLQSSPALSSQGAPPPARRGSKADRSPDWRDAQHLERSPHSAGATGGTIDTQIQQQQMMTMMHGGATAAHDKTASSTTDAAKATGDEGLKGSSSQQRQRQQGKPRRSSLDAADAAADAGRRIFVGGLHYDADEDVLRRHFSQFGPVVTAEVQRHRESQRSRGFAFVTFEHAESVQEALKQTRQDILGRSSEVKLAFASHSSPGRQKQPQQQQSPQHEPAPASHPLTVSPHRTAIPLPPPHPHAPPPPPARTVPEHLVLPNHLPHPPPMQQGPNGLQSQFPSLGAAAFPQQPHSGLMYAHFHPAHPHQYHHHPPPTHPQQQHSYVLSQPTWTLNPHHAETGYSGEAPRIAWGPPTAEPPALHTFHDVSSSMPPQQPAPAEATGHAAAMRAAAAPPLVGDDSGRTFGTAPPFVQSRRGLYSGSASKPGALTDGAASVVSDSQWSGSNNGAALLLHLASPASPQSSSQGAAVEDFSAYGSTRDGTGLTPMAVHSASHAPPPIRVTGSDVKWRRHSSGLTPGGPLRSDGDNGDDEGDESDSPLCVQVSDSTTTHDQLAQQQQQQQQSSGRPVDLRIRSHERSGDKGHVVNMGLRTPDESPRHVRVDSAGIHQPPWTAQAIAASQTMHQPQQQDDKQQRGLENDAWQHMQERTRTFTTATAAHRASSPPIPEVAGPARLSVTTSHPAPPMDRTSTAPAPATDATPLHDVPPLRVSLSAGMQRLELGERHSNLQADLLEPDMHLLGNKPVQPQPVAPDRGTVSDYAALDDHSALLSSSLSSHKPALTVPLALATTTVGVKTTETTAAVAAKADLSPRSFNSDQSSGSLDATSLRQSPTGLTGHTLDSPIAAAAAAAASPSSRPPARRSIHLAGGVHRRHSQHRPPLSQPQDGSATAMSVVRHSRMLQGHAIAEATGRRYSAHSALSERRSTFKLASSPVSSSHRARSDRPRSGSNHLSSDLLNAIDFMEEHEASHAALEGGGGRVSGLDAVSGGLLKVVGESSAEASRASTPSSTGLPQ